MRSAGRYSIAVIGPVLAFALTAALPELVAPMRLFFFWCAVLMAAVAGGGGPAVVAIALSLIGATLLIFDPIGSFALASPTDLLRLGLFATFAGAISYAVASRRRAEERSAAMAAENARLYEAAQAANRTKDEFLATLSHELRTPLTAIAGWAHMLHNTSMDDATRKLAVETILSSARAQGELIDDLLDLSRIVSGNLHMTVGDVDLAAIIREVANAVHPAAEAKAIAVSIDGADRAFRVRGDERRLRQVIWNLLSNAVKFTDAGGSVQVRITQSPERAGVEVTDTGRGIDAAFLPHVFDRFRQADSSASRAHGGLGLGLAVVRHLVELHGGTVGAESAGLGRGARFWFDLPLTVLEQPAMAAVPLLQRE